MSDSPRDTSDDDARSGGSQNESGSDGGNSDREGGKGKNWLEWTVTLAGAILVLLVLGFLAYEWASSTGQPAELTVALGAPSVEGAAVEIPVTVRNEGAKVAEAAVVEVCAGPGSCAQLTFDYVPFKSEVSGEVGLEAPLTEPLSSRVVSYRNP